MMIHTSNTLQFKENFYNLEIIWNLVFLQKNKYEYPYKYPKAMFHCENQFVYPDPKGSELIVPAPLPTVRQASGLG